MTTARESESQIAFLLKNKGTGNQLYRTELNTLFCSNILKLMNAFHYPENNITESNYDEVLNHLNQTSPDIIQELNLEICDLQAFLSQVS